MTKKYLVAVQNPFFGEKENSIFEFSTKKERANYIEYLKSNGVNYATSE